MKQYTNEPTADILAFSSKAPFLPEQIANMAGGAKAAVAQDEIISTPQFGAMCVDREGLPSARDFVADEATV
ncbi:hypothetical protein [Enterobacter cancerogenus]|uniref:hypothetical protein n=1 Tax=Enterobacter cancerogenus TaxID=69218 RepID=UPI001CB1F2A6|nr:hypothetical protein [Enterobacter cancerogenus]HBI6865586.1 hypothetical protein [Enterobacter cancerogenus]